MLWKNVIILFKQDTVYFVPKAVYFASKEVAEKLNAIVATVESVIEIV